MALLSTNNSKLRKAALKYEIITGRKATVASFTLPAGTTCPFAGKCALGCYAKTGAFCWPVPKAKHAANLEATRSTEYFETKIKAELNKLTKRGRKVFIRIHDSGDFYSDQYLTTWVAIAEQFREVTFYAYTKSVGMVQGLRQVFADWGRKFPENIVFTFSEGGKQDELVNPETDKHTKMFNAAAELEAAGYTNASEYDLIAADPSILKVGLVFHGSEAQRKAWGL